jgi:hypothetical protein
VSKDKLNIIKDIIKSFNKLDLNYSVIHGLEKYPDEIGRDIDLFIDKRHLNQAVQKVENVLKEYHFTIVRPPNLWGERVVGVDLDNLENSIEIHFITKLTWRHITFTDQPDPTIIVKGFKVDPWATFVKRILTPILAGDFKRFIKKPEELYLSEAENEIVEQKLTQLFGKYAKFYLSILNKKYSNEEIIRLKNDAEQLTSKLSLHYFKHNPLKSLRTLINTLKKRLSQPFYPCGPHIALVGCDGVGKSTVLKALKESDVPLFTKIEVKHSRPGLLPELNKLKVDYSRTKKLSDKSFQPRRTAGNFKWLRVIYYYIDYLVGYFLLDRVTLSRQSILVYDRYFLDFLVDPVRYGIKDNKGLSLFYKYLPKPDRTILLWETPEKIYSRKQELTLQEIRNQLKTLEGLYSIGLIDVKIKTDQTPKQLSEILLKEAITCFIEKNRV